MKKLVLALTAVAALTGSASAADIAARPYAKAPPAPVQPAYNWTGFYIFGGGGGGLWNADSNVQNGATGASLTRDQRLGGSGWYGTFGLGYDWQFNSRWVFGLFGDGQWGSIRGSLTDPFNGLEGNEKLQAQYAAGARLGWLVAPNVLSYVNAGYSGSQWSGTTLTNLATTTTPTVATTSSFRRDGWFVGGGFENNLDIFGITAPGWFWKTEYRSNFYDRVTIQETNPVTGALNGNAVTFKPWVQTISTSLVYRFNWTGPAVSGY
jgi:outer membrane immunogenic protein